MMIFQGYLIIYIYVCPQKLSNLKHNQVMKLSLHFLEISVHLLATWLSLLLLMVQLLQIQFLKLHLLLIQLLLIQLLLIHLLPLRKIILFVFIKDFYLDARWIKLVLIHIHNIIILFPLSPCSHNYFSHHNDFNWKEESRCSEFSIYFSPDENASHSNWDAHLVINLPLSRYQRSFKHQRP